MHSCPECLKIKDLKVPWDINAAAKCKVEILPEEEEVYDYSQERKRKKPRAQKVMYKEEDDDLDGDALWEGKSDPGM